MPISKNAQMVKFFVGRSRHGIGRTKLFKLIYLADLEARKLMGKPISDFEYHWHRHGPFDADIYDAAKELEDGEHAHTQQINHGGGYVESKLIDDEGLVPFDFSAAEFEIINFVAARFMAVPLRNLLDNVVYESRPMKEVEARGDRLDMEAVDNHDRRRIGFDFEEVVQADTDARGGDYILANEFFDGLRTEDSRPRAEAH